LTEAPLPAEETTPVVTPQSQVAAGEGTSTEVLATELPDTGVADNLRLPLLAGAAIILVLVIVLSRRLRLSAR
jgi:LPXTG-motif cell wall-anchored protein